MIFDNKINQCTRRCKIHCQQHKKVIRFASKIPAVEQLFAEYTRTDLKQIFFLVLIRSLCLQYQINLKTHKI